MAPPSPASHRFGLDLLRAASVLMVVSSHAGVLIAGWYGARDPQHLAVSGFFGVEAFFVLSGFLIGRILLGIVAAGIPPGAARRFVRRRWARTLPLYYVLLLCLVLVWRPLPWQGWGPTARIVPFFLVLAQNLAWPVRGGWFGVSWSLAVEEWFYLLFPALLFAAVRRLGARRGIAVAVGAFLLGPLLARIAAPATLDWNDAARTIVVLRLDAIAFGVALAAIDAGRWGGAIRRRRGALALAGLAVLGLQWWGGLQGGGALARRVHDVLAVDVADLGWTLLLPALDAMRRPAPMVARVVEAVAARSYGVYLMHLTLLEMAGYAVAAHGWPRPLAAAAALAATVALPSASWVWLERPILRRVRAAPIVPVAASPPRVRGA